MEATINFTPRHGETVKPPIRREPGAKINSGGDPLAKNSGGKTFDPGGNRFSPRRDVRLRAWRASELKEERECVTSADRGQSENLLSHHQGGYIKASYRNVCLVENLLGGARE